MFSTFHKAAPAFDAFYFWAPESGAAAVFVSINLPASPSLVFCEEHFHSCFLNVLLAAIHGSFMRRSVNGPAISAASCMAPAN